MANKKAKLKVPRFESEGAEAEWWPKVHFSEHVESLVSERARQRKLPPAERQISYAPPISIRFNPDQVEAIKRLAEVRGTNYQSLIKLWVAERLTIEQGRINLAPDIARSIGNLMVEVERTIEERLSQIAATLPQARSGIQPQ